MAKIVRLTESDLEKLIKRVIVETEEQEVMPDAEDAEVGATSSEVENQSNKQIGDVIDFTTPLTAAGQDASKLTKEKAWAGEQLNNLVAGANQYCKNNDTQGALQYIKDKIKEFKIKRREARKNKKQGQSQSGPVQEQVMMIVGIAIGLFLLGSMILRRRVKKYGCPGQGSGLGFGGYR